MSYQISFSVGSRYPVNRKKIRNNIKKMLSDKRISEAQVDISIIGTRKMKKLNEEMKKAKGITDVLSFCQRDPHDNTEKFPTPPHLPPHLGDVVVCYPVAVKEAMKRGKLVDDVIWFYVEHGLKHLLGEHHE